MPGRGALRGDSLPAQIKELTGSAGDGFGDVKKVARNDLLDASLGVCKGYTDAVDAELSKYFGTIPHRGRMEGVDRRIVDQKVLLLTKLWLKVPL